MLVKVIEKNAEGRGGFSFRNMGPENITILPEVAFDSDWCDPGTLKRYMKDGHIVVVEAAEATIDVAADEVAPEETVAPEAEAEPATEPTPEQEYSAEEILKAFCVVPKEELKGMSLEEINGMYKEICQQADIEYVAFKGNEGKAEAITLLSSGAAE